MIPAERLLAFLLSGMLVAAIPFPTAAGPALAGRVDTWTDGGLRIQDPCGISYFSVAGGFFVVDADIDDAPEFQNANLWEVSSNGREALRALDLTGFTREPSGIVYHAGRKTLFVTDDDEVRLHELKLSGEKLATVDLAKIGGKDPEGIAFDTHGENLFVADGRAREVLELTPAGKLVSSFSVGRLGFEDLEGIVHDPRSGHLHVIDEKQATLLELTRDGQLVASHNLAKLGAIRPRGLTLAPSSDAGDPPDALSLYVVDGMQKHHPDGRILEIALVQRPDDARLLTSLLGDVDGFGFRGSEPGFVDGDRDRDGLLEAGEALATFSRGSSERIDNRDPEDHPATDAMLASEDTRPLAFEHALDLQGRRPLWARLTLLAADARSRPGMRTVVRADGIRLGELIGTKRKHLIAGAIHATVLEFPAAALRHLEDGALSVEIARDPGTGPDELMLDYSRLEVAVAR